MTNKPQALDEQMIAIADYLIDQRDEPWPTGTDADRLHYWRDKAINGGRRLRAAHSLMAAKVAELEEALKPFAEAADFKEGGYTFELPDTAHCKVTLRDCRKARAALAPHPEGTDQ